MTDGNTEQAAWPVEIRVNQSARTLEIDFDDGASFSLPAELLRVESPSAEVQGHGEGKTLVPGKRNVAISSVEPVGNYAVRIIFDDGHDSGIYSWRMLYGFGLNRDALWAGYEQALAARGLSRG